MALGKAGPYRTPISEFLDSTSLHGMGYLAQSKSRPWYYDWFFFLAIVTGILCTFTLVFIQVQDYNSDKTRVTFDSKSATNLDVDFPSVTICNINRIRQSFLNEYGLQNQLSLIRRFFFGTASINISMTQEEISHMEQIISNSTGILNDGKTMKAFENMGTGGHVDNDFSSTYKEYTWRNFFLLAAVQNPGDKTILFAKYNKKVRNATEWAQLHPFVLTDYGYCSRIDAAMLFHPDYGHLSYSELNNLKLSRPNIFGPDSRMDESSHFRGVKVGHSQGLHMMIDVEAYDYGFAPAVGEGVKIGLGNFREESLISLGGMNFEAGSVHNVIISPVLTDTTLVAKSRFDPDVRGCYFQDEFNLAEFSDRSSWYSMTNCMFEALKQEVHEKCGCDYFFENKKEADTQICYGENYTCFREVVDSYINFQLKKNTDENVVRKCLASCHEQKNSYFISSARHPNLHLRAPTFCTIVRKINSSCTNPYKAALLNKHYGVGLDNPFCELFYNKSAIDSAACNVQTADYFMDLTGVDQKLVEKVTKYAEDNVLTVNFYFATTDVTRLLKDENLSTVWYIAAIGGILGLSMGMSVITIFEILWYCSRLFGILGRQAATKLREIGTTITSSLRERKQHTTSSK